MISGRVMASKSPGMMSQGGLRPGLVKVIPAKSGSRKFAVTARSRPGATRLARRRCTAAWTASSAGTERIRRYAARWSARG